MSTQIISFLCFSDLELQRHTSKPWSPTGQFDFVNHLQNPAEYAIPAKTVQLVSSKNKIKKTQQTNKKPNRQTTSKTAITKTQTLNKESLISHIESAGN